MPPRRVLHGVGDCVDCLAWGVVGARRCSSCNMLRHHYRGEDAECTGCGRLLRLKRGYCRLCRQQAAYESKTAGGLPRGAVTVPATGNRLTGHQLFFDRMKLRRPESPPAEYGRRRGMPPKPPPASAGRRRCGESRRGCSRRLGTSPGLTSPPVSISPTHGCGGRSIWPISAARPAAGDAACASRSAGG